MLLVDLQAGLGFGVESASRQVVLNNAVALARTAVAFKVPIIASTSASRVTFSTISGIPVFILLATKVMIGIRQP
jgi:nicotinamidase-related amidase